MTVSPQTILPLRLLVLTLLILSTGTASASGDIGDHVNNLKAHLGEYEQNINQFLGQVNGMVATYAEKGAGAVDTSKLIDWWEADLKYHAAIETQYAPIYANIWQGIYGVKQSIEQGKPAEVVRSERDALARALWQGLGAVKLAAANQQKGTSQAAKPAARGGAETVDQILGNLDTVVDRYRSGAAEGAKDLVHSTYAELFEGIEGGLIEQDAALVEDLEKDFNVTLPQLIEGGAPAGQVADTVSAMKDKLARAQKLLSKAEQNKKDVF